MNRRSIELLTAGLLAMMAGVSIAQHATQPAPSLVPPPAAKTVETTADEIPQPGGAHPLTRADLDVWLDGYMPYALRTGDIAGAVVVVVKDGQILTQRGYGWSDVAKRKPVDPERTLFRPGSVAKLFTWTAVMQLVEQGKVDLDEDVNTYLDFRIPPFDGKPVTLRQAMTHTTGFEETGKNIIFYEPSRLMSLGDYLKAWIPKRIFAPGTTPAYSNYATALAGYIVERLSGQSFDDYIEQYIFAPLGMKNSTFRQPLPPHFRAMMSQGYPVGSGEPSRFELVGPAPAGSLASTGADMGHFMIAHLQKGAFGDSRILRPETAEMMHNTPLTLLPPLNRMELGFFETNINGREVIAHLGDTQAFHTALHLFLEENTGLYVSVNSVGKDGAAGAVRGGLFDDFADRYFPGDEKDGRVDAKTATEHARMMVGRWQNSRRSATSFLAALSLPGQVAVSVGPKGELSMPGEARKWIEIAPFVWRDADSHERLAAKVVDGKVVRFSFDGISPFMVFEPVLASHSAAWLMPALYVSLGALALSVIFWPVAAIVRRRYGARLALERRALLAYRGVRVAAALILAVLIGWMAVIMAMSGDGDNPDALLWLLQVAGLIVFVGGFVVALVNARVVWTGKRRWTAKLWSVVLVLATLVILWTAFAFKLLAFTVNY